MEGCYIPFDWRQDFEKEYLTQIRFVCLAMTPSYIDDHFDDIMDHGSDIEMRLDDSDISPEWIKEDNQRFIEGFTNSGERILLIDRDYEETIERFL